MLLKDRLEIRQPALRVYLLLLLLASVLFDDILRMEIGDGGRDVVKEDASMCCKGCTNRQGWSERSLQQTKQDQVRNSAGAGHS